MDVFPPAVSPDGLWIAGTSGSESAAQVVKIPIDGGEPVRLGEGAWPAWSPDGRQLAFISRRSGSPRVWVSGADGQWPKEVKDSAVGDRPPTWLPDGRLAWQTPDQKNYRIRDLGTGRDEYLFKGAWPAGRIDPEFSPRGDQLVMQSGFEPGGGDLWQLSWPGRDPRFLIPRARPVGWSEDGEWVYAIQWTSDDQALVRVSPRTRESETVGQFPPGYRLNYCDLAPDRDVIICSLSEWTRSDAWVMENFDPDVP
jgi:hypothetical protein